MNTNKSVHVTFNLHPAALKTINNNTSPHKIVVRYLDIH